MSTAAPPKPPPAVVAPKNGATPAGTALTPTRSEPKFTPPAIVLYAVDGWGKTSTASHAPSAAFLMAPHEYGYETLLGAGRVPALPTAKPETWADLLATVHGIAASRGEVRTLVLDALGGFERLCHQFVCDRDFGGDWGEKGFQAFQRGYAIGVSEWVKLLAALDAVRAAGVMVLILSHSHERPYQNPLGDNFDRFMSDAHEKTWSVTRKWADAVLFGNFVTVTQEKKHGQVKGIGGADRELYTERRDAYDAKNRYGMPEVITIPNDPAQCWDVIWSHIRGAAK